MPRLVCFMLLLRLTLAAQPQDLTGLWLSELHTGPASLHLVGVRHRSDD
jgi:hypothetical protein